MTEINKDLKKEVCENSSDFIGCYSFYDKKAQRYDTPFYAQNDLFAKRHFIMARDREGTMLNKFQSEFELHRFGYFAINTGVYTALPETLEIKTQGENR